MGELCWVFWVVPIQSQGSFKWQKEAVEEGRMMYCQRTSTSYCWL